MSRDDASLADMLRAARSATEFLGELSRGEFEIDAKTQSAVLHELLIIGEAASRITPEFRSRHGEIRWKSIVGMRNRLIHGYDQVDVQLVWDTMKIDIPMLIKQIDAIEHR